MARPVSTSATLPSLRTDRTGGQTGLTATYFGTPDWSGPAVLTKVEDRCVFCASELALIEFSGKLVCHGCIDRITSARD